MEINERRRISPKHDLLEIFHGMMFGNHKKFAPLYQEIATLDASEIAGIALTSPQKAHDTTLCMIALENVGFSWQEDQLFNYNGEFVYQGNSFKNSIRKELLVSHIKALAQGVNNHVKPVIGKTCYDAIHMLDADDMLLNDRISLDRIKCEEYKGDLFEFIESFDEERSREVWNRILPHLVNHK